MNTKNQDTKNVVIIGNSRIGVKTGIISNWDQWECWDYSRLKQGE